MILQPNDTVRVLCAAAQIPDTAEVTKRTGEEVYTLRHNLTLYPDDPERKAGAKALVVEGFFLVSSRGAITQVTSEKLLHWVVTAQEFRDHLLTIEEESNSQ